MILVDTLLLPSDSKELKTYIEKLSSPLRYIINTHWHSDHCYGNHYFTDNDPIFLAHERYMDTITNEKNMLSKGRKTLIDKKLLIPPTITFNCMLHLPKTGLHLIHTPGHSFDSICIYLAEEKILIAGDTVLSSDRIKVSIPYYYWGNPHLFLKSIELIMSLDIDWIIPGHGIPITPVRLKQDHEYLTRILQFENDVLPELLHQPINKIKENYPVQYFLPDLSTENLWVPAMHELNLERSIKNIKNEV